MQIDSQLKNRKKKKNLKKKKLSRPNILILI